MQYPTFDYLPWWKYAVNTLKISPTEAWGLDYVELATLAEIESKSNQDASFMVNSIRIQNGCDPSLIKNEASQ